MKKYIIPFIVFVIAFVLSFVLLGTLKIKPSDVKVEVNAIVPLDDIFQVFYQQDGMTYFAEKQSVITVIKGSNEYQKIDFIIPLSDKPILKLRFDVGSNKKQKPMIIEDFKLVSLRNSSKFNLTKDFTRNDWVRSNGDTIYTQVINNRYDPYFTSAFDVKEVMMTLSREQLRFDKIIIILFSLIISITLFFACYYKNIRLDFNYIVIVLFLLILIAPTFVKILGVEIKTSNTEKRELAKKPEFSISKSYPKLYETYYNDNFGLRTLFINWNSQIKLNYLKVSPNPESVLLGKSGFMFYNSKSDAIYDSYSNANIVNNRENLTEAIQKQREIKEMLVQKDIEYIVGFFPNKHTIYRSHLPFSMYMQINGNTTLADQIVSSSEENNFDFIDVRKALWDEKTNKQLYCKFDTHWNSYGAYIAYKSFFEQTKTLGIIPYDTSFFDIRYSQKKNGDLIKMIGIDSIKSYYDTIPNFKLKNPKKGYKEISAEGFPKRTVITLNENCNNKKTVLVFRDSFTSALVPFFSLHFYKVIYIWQHSVDMALVEKTEPDIVMSLCVERYLTHLLK